MRSNSIDIYHVVTAAEAAYASLIGHYSEQSQEWVEDLLPIHSNIWPITLRSAYVELIRANVHVVGVYLQMYALASNVRPVALISAVQGVTDRCTWFGELPTRYGFGIVARFGAIQADDEIRGGVIYEYV
jgi:hypothetical protein